MNTREEFRLSATLTTEQIQEILADVKHDPILIDHHASKLFPKSPEDRLNFRKAIRTMISNTSF